MSNFSPRRIPGLLLLLWFLTGCNTSYRADLGDLLAEGALPKLKQSKLIQVSSHDTSGGNDDRIIIPAASKATILDVSGPGVIVRIWMTIDSRDPYFLRRVLIRMYWDREEYPSVEVPFGDFFGCGFEYKQYSTPYLGMNSGGYVCFFPMPFEKSARIEIVNETGLVIPAFYYHIDYQKLEKPLDNDIGYFHAYWNRNIRTNYDSGYTVLNVKGKGHLVGVNMNVQSYDGSLQFLEGDEKIFVDGEKKPSIYGTGLEDYFSSGWYFSKGEYAGPYNGLILKDDSLGRIAAYRFHIPDPVPFKKSLKFTIEHGHGNTEIADYSSTAYWYQLEPHKNFPRIIKAGLRIPLRSIVPNRLLEAENMKFNPGSVKATIQDMSDYGPEWSGAQQLLFEGNPNETFTWVVEGLNENKYNLQLFYTKGPDYGNASIFINDQKVGEIKGYSLTLTHGGSISISNIKNPGKVLLIKFVIDGKSPYSLGYKVGLDGINPNPNRKYIPEWYVAGPFPNPRKAEANRRGLDSIYPPEKLIDLYTALSGYGGKEVRWQYLQTPEKGYVNLVNLINPHELVVSYALTYIYSTKKETVPLLIGTDDGAKVFFNNKQMYRYLGVRVAEPDQAEIQLNINPGWNKLLLKIENNMGGYGFFARLVDKDSSLVISANQKMMNPKTKSKTTKK